MSLMKTYLAILVIAVLLGIGIYAVHPVKAMANGADCPCLGLPHCVCPAPSQDGCPSGWCAYYSLKNFEDCITECYTSFDGCVYECY